MDSVELLKKVSKMAWSFCFVALSLAFFAQTAMGHVALTFPPARKYDLDFLDNARTKAPCGMPKGNYCLNINVTVSM